MAFDFIRLCGGLMRRWNVCKPCCRRPNNCCTATDCNTPADGSFGLARGTPRLTISNVPDEVYTEWTEVWTACPTQNPPFVYPCWIENDLTNIARTSWFGLDRLNGSYSPTPYYVSKTTGLGTSDPDDASSLCGFWLYPIIDLAITLVNNNYYELMFQGGTVEGCIPNRQINTQEYNFKFRTLYANLDIPPGWSWNRLSGVPWEFGTPITWTKTINTSFCDFTPPDEGTTTYQWRSNDPLRFENYPGGLVGPLYTSRNQQTLLTHRSNWSIGFGMGTSQLAPIDGFPPNVDVISMTDCRQGMIFSNFSCPSYDVMTRDRGLADGSCRHIVDLHLSPFEITRQFDVIPE